MRRLLLPLIMCVVGCSSQLRVFSVTRATDGGASVGMFSTKPGAIGEDPVIDREIGLAYDAAGHQRAPGATAATSCAGTSGYCVPAGGNSDTEWLLSDGSTVSVDLDHATLSRTGADGHVEWQRAIGKLQTMDVLEFPEPLFDDALYFSGLDGGDEWLVKIASDDGATAWSVDLSAAAN